MAASSPANFATLLQQAVNEPGMIHQAYTTFWNYSFGNVLLAWSQCVERGITPGPLATYQRWRELGRQVRKGEKALTLCRPITIKRSGATDDGTDDEPGTFTRFIYKPFWFTLVQTTDSHSRRPLRQRGTPRGHLPPGTCKKSPSTR